MRRLLAVLLLLSLPTFAAAVALIANGNGTNHLTGATVTLANTTGATLLVAVLANNSGADCTSAAQATPADTVGGVATNNKWRSITPYRFIAAGAAQCVWYTYGGASGEALVVGATHVITTGYANYVNMGVSAWSGTLTGASSPLDVSTGATSTTNSVNTGSITPATCGLILSGAGLRNATTYTSSPLTALDNVNWITGNTTGLGVAYTVQSSAAAAVSNTWTMGATGQIAATIVSFKGADGCGAAATTVPRRSIIQ